MGTDTGNESWCESGVQGIGVRLRSGEAAGGNEVDGRRGKGGKGTHELVFLTADVGDVHVVGGGADILLLN
jgi:hypothetical protein